MEGPFTDSQASDLSHVTHHEAVCRAECVSAVEYSLTLYLSVGRKFAGDCCISFDCNKAQKVWIDFSAQQILTFTVNSRPERPDWRQGKLHLTASKGRNVVQVKYICKYRRDGTGLSSLEDIADGEQYVFSQFEADFAHLMLPCFDQPDLKATLTLQVVAPVRWTVVSNEPGEASEFTASADSLLFPPTGDYHIYSFRTTPLISTYLFAVCAGPFAVVYPLPPMRVPSALFYRKSIYAQDTSHFFHWMEAALRYYEDFFQVQYPFSKLDLVFIAEGRFVAMENVGCVTLTDTYLLLGEGMQVELAKACNTLLHEIAHMWFGNLVTLKWWEDLWLNESFATYISYCCQNAELHDSFPFCWRLFLSSKEWGYESDVRSTTHPISVTVSDTSEVDTNFDGISYAKGSAVLKQLHYLLGDGTWREALRHYIAANKYGNTAFADLISTFSAHAKENGLAEDIEGWAEMWIKTSGLNTLSVRWTEANSIISSFSILQGSVLPAHSTLRLHKLELELYDAQMTRIAQCAVTVLPQAETAIPALCGLRAPACAILNTGDYDFVKVILDEKSLKFLSANIRLVPEHLTRQVVIKAIWDRVTDIEVSGAEFIDSFLPYFEWEDDYFLSEIVLGLMEKAAKSMLPFGVLERTYNSRIFQACLKRLCNASSKTLMKVTLGKTFRFLKHPRDIQQAVDWLHTGMPTDPPIFLNQVGRWLILAAYSSISVSAKDLVDAEFSKDPSLQAKYYKLQCESAYPNPILKERAWRSIQTQASSMTATEAYYAAAGFNCAAHVWLFHPYFSQYAPALQRMYDTVETRVVKTLSVGLVPAYAEPARTVQLLETLIPTVPKGRPDLLRDLIESKEDLEQDAQARYKSEQYFYRTST